MNKPNDAEVTDAETTKIWFSIWIREFMVLLFMLGLVGLTGCSVAYRQHLEENAKKGVESLPFKVVEIDGCQYIYCYNWFCHKGNCTNPIHIYNNQIRKEK